MDGQMVHSPNWKISSRDSPPLASLMCTIGGPSTAPQRIYRLKIAVDQEEQSVDYMLRGNKQGGWLPPVGSPWKTDAKSILQGTPLTNTLQWFYQLEENHGALPKHKYSGAEFNLITLSVWQLCLQRLRNLVLCFRICHCNIALFDVSFQLYSKMKANREIKINDKIIIGW